MGGDAVLTLWVAGAGLVGLFALAVVGVLARRIVIAFREGLHRLPGARWWRRGLHALRFWATIALYVAIMLACAAYLVVATRYVRLWLAG
jgi:hypothetical protein